MLAAAFESRGVELQIVDDRAVQGRLGQWPEALPRTDVVLLRSKSHWRNVVLARWLETLGGRPVNGSDVLETCGDKVRTTLALLAAGVPTTEASVALDGDGAHAAATDLGFPVVVKPVIGSWGRLIGKVNDDDALTLAIEHKEAIGGAPHAVVYLQPFVPTGGRDIRSFVVGGRCIAAITRTSEQWRTNTALGAKAAGMTLDDDLIGISEAAAQAVGGGIVAVDIFETPEGYRVNEVNGTMEFRNSVATTGVDIPGAVAEYLLGEAPASRGAEG